MTDVSTQQRLLYLEGYVRRLVLAAGPLPPGGATGQVLGKASNADNDVTWLDMGIASDGAFTVCDGTIDVTGATVGAFFDFTEGAP